MTRSSRSSTRVLGTLLGIALGVPLLQGCDPGPTQPALDVAPAFSTSSSGTTATWRFSGIFDSALGTPFVGSMTFTPDLLIWREDYGYFEMPDLVGSVVTTATFGCGVGGVAGDGSGGESAYVDCSAGDGGGGFSFWGEHENLRVEVGNELLRDPISFLLNPENGGGLNTPVSWYLDIPALGGRRLVTSLDVTLAQSNPTSKDDCKNGGWEDFGFKNQGQCVRYVETGKDSRG